VGFFPGLSTSQVDAVSTVARVGWRNRRGLGIPGKVADSSTAAVLCDTTRRAVVARVMAGGMGSAGGIRGTRAEGRGQGKDDRGFGETIELSGKVLKNTHDLAGDLLGVKTRALQTYPLKMNLVLEIRLVPEQVGKLIPQRVLSFPCGFFYSVSVPLDSAHSYL
jgi:hypothetical protein